MAATRSGVPVASTFPPSPHPRAEVDDPVGGLDHVEVVLDHDHGVPGVDQAVEDVEQPLDVSEVEAGGGLVEDVKGVAGGDLGLGGELDRCASPPESWVAGWPSRM